MEVKFPHSFDGDAPEKSDVDAAKVGLIDRAHLLRQTMGDEALSQEVLGLFDEQLKSAVATLPLLNADERFRLAHTIKGSAAGIGATSLAVCAEELERDASNQVLVEQLSSLIDEVRTEIAGIVRSRPGSPDR